MRASLKFYLLFSVFFFSFGILNAQDKRPNIIWIMIEDWSTDLSCYGTKGIHTPNIDKLASQGVLYKNAFTTAPVCSPSRSAMMTGYYQNFIGANQHREGNKKPLPEGIKPITTLLKETGYYTCILQNGAKTDVNFLPANKEELFENTKDWNGRKAGQPFFAQMTFTDSHRDWNRDPIRPIDGKDIELPPYYADTPFNRRDWANGFEQMQIVDRQVGKLLKRLKDEGLEENTLVFFIGDNGQCHIRGKQFLYDAGTHVPMIIRWPGVLKPQQINADLVMSIDISATILAVAGAKTTIPLHGKNLFESEISKRKYVFTARDKMDKTHDAMRAIRSKDFKLILNLMPERPYLQYSNYKEGSYPMLAEMGALYQKGKLNAVQAAFFAPTKPKYELYHIKKDSFETINLADNPKYKKVKDKLLKQLSNWRINVIHDVEPSSDFRAKDVYIKQESFETLDKWLNLNQNAYDFEKYGWPAWYPTRTLVEWEKAVNLWTPYLFREPKSKTPKPQINELIPGK